jgi:diphthamide biosynthesis protein 3
MSYYDEVEIEDMVYDAEKFMYFYPCPCGDKFRIALEDLHEGEEVADCPSCTLRIKVIYDDVDLPELPPDFEEKIAESGD